MSRAYADLADYETLQGDSYSSPFDSGDYFTLPIQDVLPEDRKRRRRSRAIMEEDNAIEAEIVASKSILSITADDDDDPTFVPYEPTTRLRVVDFFRRLALSAHSCGFSGLGVPEILPGDQGSIGLFWRAEDRQLLMTFPSDPDAMVSYFGRRGPRDIAGRFPSGDCTPDLVYWLAS